jgi:hypothetical protein
MASITIETEEYPWSIDGERRTIDDGAVMLKPSELTALEIDELRKGFLAYAELYDTDESDCRAVVYSGGDEVYFDLDAPVSTISFGLANGKLLVRVEFMADYPDDDDFDRLQDEVRRLILPLSGARRAPLLKLSSDRDYSLAPLGHVFFTADFEAPADAQSLQDLYDLGTTVDALVDAFIAQVPTRDTVAGLIRGGSAASLVGQPEGNWLDVKSREYDLAEPRGKHSLAVEVAAFCNAEDGGVIVFGARTKTPLHGGGEVIAKVGGLDTARFTPRQYLQILNDWVYPFPFGLQVNEIPLPSGKILLLVDIPAQNEELKPFLVKGARNEDGNVEFTGFTVAQRRGEDTVNLQASMLHTQLAAGRAFLRRGHGPA